MELARLVREHLIGWTTVAFGAGAAAGVALVGIPKLWTAEAAGWASAIGTIFAGGVALWLGIRAVVGEARARRHRHEVAFRKTQVVALRIFDEVEMIAGGPGICLGEWDDRTVDYLLTAARRLNAACMDLDALLFDLNDDVSLVFADLCATGMGMSAQISEFERHERDLQLSLADYLTHGVHAQGHRLLKMEAGVMAFVGVKTLAGRMLHDRAPRAGDF